MAEHSPSGTLSAPQLPEQVSERIAGLELRIREQDEAVRLRDTELSALERDLVVKEAFVRRLERDQQVLAVELAQVRARAAELFADLEAAEARVAAGEARLAELAATPAFRLATRLAVLARRLGPLAAPLSRVASAALGRGPRGA